MSFGSTHGLLPRSWWPPAFRASRAPARHRSGRRKAVAAIAGRWSQRIDTISFNLTLSEALRIAVGLQHIRPRATRYDTGASEVEIRTGNIIPIADLATAETLDYDGASNSGVLVG